MVREEDQEMATSKRTRNGVLRLSRIFAASCILGAVLWASSPHQALAFNQEISTGEEEEEEESCGQNNGDECKSIGFCIDLFKIFTVCGKSYFYYS